MATTSTERGAWSTKAFIDATGAEVENIEEATGFRYQELDGTDGVEKAGKVGTPKDFQVAQTAGSKVAMLAVFGAITLATNTASPNHNPKAKQYKKYATDLDAVVNRLESRMSDGTWDSEAGESQVGRGIDSDALADAVVEFGATGNVPVPDKATLLENFKVAEVRKAFKDHPDIRPIYNRIVEAKRPVAKPAQTLAEMLAAMAGTPAQTT
jgi:hypothetical protein